MKCDAITPPSTYKREPTPCAKRLGIRPHRLGRLCKHHRNTADRRGTIPTRRNP